MALSFGLGLSTQMTDAKDRQQKKRLENKKIFDDWLANKKLLGESVKAEDLENEKYTITGGDSLYGDWIGNEAAMKSMTARHNQFVTDKLLAEQTATLKTKIDQEKYLDSQIDVYDTFDSYSDKLLKLVSRKGEDPQKGHGELVGRGLIGEPGRKNFERKQDKVWDTEITSQMAQPKWATLDTEAHVRENYSQFPPKFIEKIVGFWQADQKGLIDLSTSKAVSQIIQKIGQTTDLKLTELTMPQITKMVEGMFLAQGNINADNITPEMIALGVGQYTAQIENSQMSLINGIKADIKNEFMKDPRISGMISGDKNFSNPSRETITSALKQALTSAKVPEWAIDEYLDGGEIWSEEAGDFSSWVKEELGDNFQNEIGKMLYQHTFEKRYTEGKENAPEGVKLRSEENEKAIMLETHLSQYGDTFYDKDKEGQDGLIVLSSLMSKYHVPSEMAGAILTALKENLDNDKTDQLNTQMLLTQ